MTLLDFTAVVRLVRYRFSRSGNRHVEYNSSPRLPIDMAIKLDQPSEKTQAVFTQSRRGHFSSLREKSTLCRRVDNYAIKEWYYAPSCPSSGACMWRNMCVYILRKAETISDYRSRTFFSNRIKDWSMLLKRQGVECQLSE